MSRIYWIDLAKIIGLFLVIFAHLYTSEGVDESNTIRTYIYGFHMPFFFMISGFLAKKRRDGLLFSLKKNVQSLLIPFLFFNVFFSLFYGLTTESNVLSQFYKLFKGLYTATGTPCKASWFVICLFYIKCIFDISIQKKLLKFVFVVVVSLTCIPLFFPSFYLPSRLFIGQTIIGLVFYIFGYYLKNCFPQKIPFIVSILGTPLFFYLSYLATLFNGKISVISVSIHNPLLFYASSLSGTLGVILFSNLFKDFVQEKKIVATISNASIGVLLLHMVFVDYVKNVRLCFSFDGTSLFGFYVFSSILIYIICVILYNLSVKIIPFIYGKR